MQKFKSPKQALRFLPVHGQIRNLFGAHRYKMAASEQRKHLIFAVVPCIDPLYLVFGPFL